MGDSRNIPVVEPGHADPTAGDQVNAVLFTQDVHLPGAKAGITEHAALGQQIGKITLRLGGLQGPSPARARMALMRVRMASTSSCHKAFSAGALSTCDTTWAPNPGGLE